MSGWAGGGVVVAGSCPGDKRGPGQARPDGRTDAGMARLNWCLAAVISWGKFLFACIFPLRGAKRDKVRPQRWGGGGRGNMLRRGFKWT